MSNLKKSKCQHCNILPFEPTSISSFCYDCGSVVIRDPGTNSLRYFSKPLNQNRKTAMNPIEIALLMKDKTEKSFMNDSNKISNWYYANRKKVLSYLQSLTLHFQYTDATFYTTLLFLDRILRKENGEDSYMTKKLDYFIVGFFILIAKLNENNIFEPDLNEFTSFNDKYQMNSKEIRAFELSCLSLVDYNIIDFSAYDWISLFLSNGFIFEDEMDLTNSINTIYSFTKKTLASITNKDFFLLFSPFQIAFSIIKLTRDKYITNRRGEDNFNTLCDLYSIKASDYKLCYQALQDELKKKATRGPMKHQTAKDLSCNLLYTKTSPNVDALKRDEHYQIECSTIVPKKKSSNDLKSSVLLKGSIVSKKSSSNSINTNKEKKSTQSNHTLYKVSLFKDEEPQKRKPVKKQFKTMKVNQKLNFEDIRRMRTTKNSFVNNDNTHMSYNKERNDSSVKSKICGSFIGTSKVKNKIKLLTVEEKVPMKSFVMNTETAVNSIRYKISNNVISQTQRSKKIISIHSKLPMISKLSGYM